MAAAMAKTAWRKWRHSELASQQKRNGMAKRRQLKTRLALQQRNSVAQKRRPRLALSWQCGAGGAGALAEIIKRFSAKRLAASAFSMAASGASWQQRHRGWQAASAISWRNSWQRKHQLAGQQHGESQPAGLQPLTGSSAGSAHLILPISV